MVTCVQVLHLDVPHCSHKSPLVETLSVSSCMLTRLASQVLGQHKGTLWLHIVLTFLHTLEMAMVLVVGMLLDGFQLYAFTFLSFLSLITFQVKESAKDKNKPEFVTFKRTVWHQSFSEIIQSVATLSKTGCWIQCGDGIKHWLFPTILILSADYEEQYVIPFS